jgi:hypothetical protein
VYGNAQVCDNAWVCGDARVYGDARVCDHARVYGQYAGAPYSGPVAAQEKI